MKFLKNAIAFFAMLAVAAAGIFLPGYFLQKNGEEQLGAVRQPDGDYYTGTGALTAIQDMTMEDKLRLTSGVWESKRELVWSGLSHVDPPSLNELKAGTFSGNSDASEQNQDEHMEKEDELKQNEAAAIYDPYNKIGDWVANEDYWAANGGDWLSSLLENAITSMDKCFREVYPYLEFAFDVNMLPRIYQYSDTYFGTYRCWSVEAGFTFYIYNYNDATDTYFQTAGGTLWLALDLETGELLHVISKRMVSILTAWI